MTGMIVLQIVLILLNAVFACAEIAVLSVNQNRMEKMAEKGDAAAARVEGFLRAPERFLATIQVAITLSGFLGSAFAADNFAGSLTDWLLSLGVSIPRSTLQTISVIGITLILSYFTLVFGELVPKRLAMRKAESLSLKMSGFLKGVYVVFRPLVWLLSASTNGVLKLMGINPDEEEEAAGEEEILLMVESGKIEPSEKELISNVFQFDDVDAGTLCTHRTDVVFLDRADSKEEWEREIHASRFDRYPVRSGEDDEVTGILDTKDFFRLEEQSKDEILRQAVHETWFVPENMKADDLLIAMKQKHRKMAVVLDEYGGVEGIITMTDLLEALVGDLEGEEFLKKESPDTVYVQGNLPLEKIENALDLEIGQDAQTITGLVYESLERVLQDGETLQVDAGPVSIDILEVKNRKVFRSRIHKK